MNSKITILADDKPLTLAQDFSISLEMKNPLFNDDEMFSYPIELPVEGNRHVLKNIDHVDASMRAVSLEHTPMRIVVDGVPFASGPAVVTEGERVGEKFSLSIDASRQSFADLISDIKCNEVPIPARYHDQLLIGEKIDEVNVCVQYNTDVTIKYEGKKGDKVQGSVGSYTVASTFSPQALGFSYPAKCREDSSHTALLKEEHVYPDGAHVKIPQVEQSYINVTDPYPIKPFCNARVCYAHHELNDDGTTADSLVSRPQAAADGKMYEDAGPIWVLEADRPQSGICFYVLFFLDCLFESLGVSFDKSALTAIGDFNRLCFFTTKCTYTTEPLHYSSRYTADDDEVKSGKKKEGDIKLGYFKSVATRASDVPYMFDDVNRWLSSRGCGGKLVFESPREKSVQKLTYYPVRFGFKDRTDGRFPNDKFKDSVLEAYLSDKSETVEVGRDGVASITTITQALGSQTSASVVRMYADERNFPEESVSDVIDSLEQQFGIKFHYDYERKKVTAYLMRDVFRRQNPEPRRFNAQITSMEPMSEKITGVRACYSEESESKEQQRNVKNFVTDYNTDYDYIDYPQNRTVTDLTYKQILKYVSSNQMNLFIDRTTGNKFRVKIDRDFSNVNDMNPRLFEVGANKGVEVGDCSAINEDYVVEMASGFKPVSMVDTNYRKAQLASFDHVFYTDDPTQPTTGSGIIGNMTTEINADYAETVMAALVDTDMEHEFVTQYIKNPLSSAVADFYVTEELSLIESYDPSGTADGNSPLQSYDWGLSIAIMRGGGTGASHESYDYNYDHFGNSKWRTTAGQYALTTDSVDCYGNVYDYNGTEAGIGDEERFSLKPRAWVQPKWADSPIVTDDPLIRNRGYVDTFLIDYIYFLLNRKKYYITCLAEVAQIADVQHHWREWWLINGRKCLINQISANIDVQNGMGEVEMEVYAL